MIDKSHLSSRSAGSIIGGAAGDALGYEVEFMQLPQIINTFGREGIREFVLHTGAHGQRAALFSDDTQMTLFTARALTRRPADMTFLQSVEAAYMDWYGTQSGRICEASIYGLAEIAELNERRAPGNTCMSALRAVSHGSAAVNDSKGCGGVMRIAPIAIYGAAHGMDALQCAQLAAEASSITHLHPLGYIPAAFVAYVIHGLMLADSPDATLLRSLATEGAEAMSGLFPDQFCHVALFKDLIERTLLLAANNAPDTANIALLGQGWVAEEAAAIALYCALRHFDDFGEALCAASNHSGDSDSTAAIAGNILGAARGIEALHPCFINNLELLPLLEKIAAELVSD